ncbi:MAG: multidrug effflux MFS transporter [Alphaproteobacteria bacterium]|nr:multidrug effflux MFS transporter [Alphaproteobacteria bacterium]
MSVATNQRAPSLALLAAVTAIGFATLHIVVPSLPLLSQIFESSAAEAQLVLTLYLVGIALGQLFYGPVSDRFGRRPVLLGGLGLYLAGTVVCGAAWSLPVLIVGRVMQACGACAGIVLGRAIIRDVYDREAAARGIAIVMMAMTLAPAVSPSVGAYLAEWVSWRAIFLVLGVVGTAVLLLVYARLPETNVRPARLDPLQMLRAYAILARSPQFAGFALCGACASAAWFTFCASAPHVLIETLHRPPSAYGAMILLPMATYMAGNAVAARFTVQLGTAALIIAGRLLAFAALIGMALWYGLAGLGAWGLFLPIALGAIGDGLSQPAAMASGLSVHPEFAGTASGVMGFLQMTTAAIGTLVVALLPYDFATSMVTVVTVFVGLALGFGIFALHRQSRASNALLPDLRLRPLRQHGEG